MVYRPQYMRSEAVLRYNALDISALAERLKATSEPGVPDAKPRPLAVNWAMSAAPKRIVLLSPTGSSAAVIEGRRTTLQTRYFADFIAVKEHDKRRAYMLEKLTALCDLLVQAESSPVFLGIISFVRISAETSEDIAELRRKVSNGPLFKNIAPATQGGWQDFSLRIATPADSQFFENLEVSWYEERVLSIVGSPELPPNLDVNEWEMPVESQGIEIKIDMNNKRGLLNGRRSWTVKELMSLVDYYYANSDRLCRTALGLTGIEANHA